MRRSHKSKSTALSLVLLILISSLPIFPVSLVKASPDTLTLRPNGDDTVLWDIYPTTPTTHYDKVNETSPDNDATYIYTNVEPESDLFTLTDTSQTGTINSVTVWARIKTLGNERTKIGVKTYGISYWSASIIVTTSYADYSAAWTTNPNTTASWTWTEINNLIAGVQHDNIGGAAENRVTMIWAVVDYTPPVLTERSANQTLTFETQTTRVFIAGRIVEQALQFMLNVTREVIVPVAERTVNQVLSVVIDTTAQKSISKTVEKSLSIIIEVSKVAKASRAFEQSNPVQTEIIAVPILARVSEAITTLITEVTRILFLPRTAPQTINILTEATKSLSFSRELLQAFNLTIDVKRTVVFIKLAEGPINFVTIITSFKMKVFIIDQKLNVLIQTIRTITLLRVTQQPFSVEAIATILKILTRKHDQAFSMITEVTTFIGAYALIEEALLFVTPTIRFSILTRQIDGVLNMIIESLRRLSLFRTFNQPLSLIIEAIGIKLVSTRVVSQVLNVLSDVTRKLTFQRPINQFFSLFIQATRVLIRKRIIDQILTLLIDVQGVTPIEERIVYQVLSFFAQAVRQISFQRIVDLILAVKTSVISVLFPYAPPTPPAPVPRPPIGPPFDLMITEPAHVAYRWWDPTFQLAFLVVNKGTLATEAELTWVILREGIKVTSGRTTFYVTGLEKKEIAFDVSTPSIEGDYKIEAEITYPVKAEATSMFDVTIAIPTLTQTLIFIIALLILYVIQKKIRGGSAR